jgi:hypothetical protein
MARRSIVAPVHPLLIAQGRLEGGAGAGAGADRQAAQLGEVGDPGADRGVALLDAEALAVIDVGNEVDGLRAFGGDAEVAGPEVELATAQGGEDRLEGRVLALDRDCPRPWPPRP